MSTALLNPRPTDGYRPLRRIPPPLPGDIRTFLVYKGWRESRDYGGHLLLTSYDSDFQVELGRERIPESKPVRFRDTVDWELGRFTDSDVNGVAVGRYLTVDDGTGLGSLEDALSIWACHPDYERDMDIAHDAAMDEAAHLEARREEW